jgi:hypothetical protein
MVTNFVMGQNIIGISLNDPKQQDLPRICLLILEKLENKSRCRFLWFIKKFNNYILGLGFTRRKIDHCVYFKLVGDNIVYLFLCVDDILLIGKNKEVI